jgi:radical SAM protein (TIGR01212 family)
MAFDSLKRPYLPLSQHLKGRFGEKVYRVTVDGGFTCPNVDGTLAKGGCVYCDNRSFSPNRRLPRKTIRDQVAFGIDKLSARYGAAKFLVYFQAATNTYAPVEKLKRLYDEALDHPQVAGLCIGTRPDCVGDDVLELIESYARRMYVCLELGLQTIHDRTLAWMNRGHGFAEFVDAARRCEGRGFEVCAHVILGFPGESRDDMLAAADVLAALPVQGVKIHNLHVVKGTPLEAQYLAGQAPMLDFDVYVRLVADFLERLPPEMVIHRLNGDAPPKYLVAPAWSADKHRIIAAIVEELSRRGSRQGSDCEPSRSEAILRGHMQGRRELTLVGFES